MKKNKLISSVTAFAIITASGISIPQAYAQEATPTVTEQGTETTTDQPTDQPTTDQPTTDQTTPGTPTVTDTTNASAEPTVSNTGQPQATNVTVPEFPLPRFKQNKSDSSIVVTGTKSWDKDLELSPNGSADVKVNISVNGDVPNGTTVGIYDGDKLLEEAPVTDGKVTVTASKLPKDLHTLSLRSNQVDLNNMKCTADKGIDIPGSEDSTLDAIKDYESDYEAAKKKYEEDAEKIGKSVDGMLTLTTAVPDQTVTSTTVVPGGVTELPDIDTSGEKADFGPFGFIMDLLPLGAILGGVGALAGNTDIQGIQNQIGNSVGDLLNNPQINEIIGKFQSAFQQGGSQGMQRVLDELGIHGINVEQIQQQANQMMEDIRGQINGIIQQFGGGAIPGVDLSGFELPSFDISTLLPLLGGLVAVVALPALFGLGGNSGGDNTGRTVDGGTQVGADTTKTTTQVIPGGVKTTVIPAAGGEMPVPELPMPPKFIEETLGKRDVDLQSSNGGVTLDIEAGSILDCSVNVEAKPVNSVSQQPVAPAPVVAQPVRPVAPAPVAARAVQGPKVNTGGSAETESVVTKLEKIFG